MTDERAVEQPRVNLEPTCRTLRYVQPQIIASPEPISCEDARLIRPGTIICLIAQEGSPLLSDIATATQQRDSEALKRYSDEVFSQYARGLMFTDRAFRDELTLQEMPILTEFRYGGKTLAQAMLANDDLEVASASVPYNGGPLDQSKFQVVEYLNAGVSHAQHAMILVNAPRLTELERAVLSRVHEEFSEIFLWWQNARSSNACK